MRNVLATEFSKAGIPVGRAASVKSQHSLSVVVPDAVLEAHPTFAGDVEALTKKGPRSMWYRPATKGLAEHILKCCDEDTPDTTGYYKVI